jgi:hypothetical protein
VPGPTKLVSGGRYDLSFTVHVGYQKYFAHVPTERLATRNLRHDGYFFGLRVNTR